MFLVVDSREQTPYTFSAFPDVEVERGTLATGDYSLAGFESVIACERKELNDVIACLQNGNRERFEKELCRARAFERFYVVIEGTLADVLGGRYRSKMTPKAVIASIAAFTNRYGVPFLFCGGRGAAEMMTYELLAKFGYEIEKRYQQMRQHNGKD